MPDAGGEGAPPEGDVGGGEDLSQEVMPEVPEEDVAPEEIELAKLAIRALYFNIESKDVHAYKVKTRSGEVIPFEKLADYFEKTKDIPTTLSFIEWLMNRYEGVHSKWTEQPEIRGQTIMQKIKEFNKDPDVEHLDNGKRVYWARIILNSLLRGTPDFNVNIDDVNENSIKEIFRLLKQSFGTDTRGILPGLDSLKGPGTF